MGTMLRLRCSSKQELMSCCRSEYPDSEHLQDVLPFGLGSRTPILNLFFLCFHLLTLFLHQNKGLTNPAEPLVHTPTHSPHHNRIDGRIWMRSMEFNPATSTCTVLKDHFQALVLVCESGVDRTVDKGVPFHTHESLFRALWEELMECGE